MFVIAMRGRASSLRQWYNLSDPGAEEALYGSITMRRFAGVSTDEDVIPDKTSILNCHRPLEKHCLTERLLAEINPPRPGTRTRNATPRCTRLAGASSGISA